MKILFYVDQDLELDSDDEISVKDATSCLKQYLKELPESLIPINMHEKYVDALSEFIIARCIVCIESLLYMKSVSINVLLH